MAQDTINTRMFLKEIDFEKALTELLPNHGWEKEVIMNPTEEDLVKNWADIIYANNRDINRLGNCPLTKTEMQQIMEKMAVCDGPYAINRLINGELISIKRDNMTDINNFGKEVYLKLFDAREISSGQSRYQIVRQPKFKTESAMAGDRRGDVMLLINGMPVIHIELKRSKVDVTQAAYQIKRYMHEGVFSNGIFRMVQIFVAMTPEETLYFANPGTEEKFKPEFMFHWADFDNMVVNDWHRVVSDLLSIPMAHQLIGYYTIADEKDKTLKVLRSYQYYAANKICDVTHRTNWDAHQHRGGYVWHTTGSGKTMTSFKSAQLIAKSGDADKVVFLMDRIELSTQSLDEYRGFAGEDEAIQDTQNTAVLVSKLKSRDNDDRLIVTSIQKMSNVNTDKGIAKDEIEYIGRKRLVFILDECHRSVFGEMLTSIKKTFPRALFFGFTGTPIFDANAHDEITTATLFGDTLHKYTIAYAIPDHNVLGFDPYKVTTYDENELRENAALSYLEAKSFAEIEDDEEKMKVYDRFINDMEMPATYLENGKQVHGVEYYLPKDLYRQPVHHQAVAQDIVSGRDKLSQNKKFHAILATENITEAIDYYHLFKKQYPSFNVVAVFDNTIANSEEGIVREDALIEMLTDYNLKYNTTFELATYQRYKKDVAKRLAHKKPYKGIETDHRQQIDLLIVVTQMLTGYDSPWINTLYVDKLMKYVDVIQAFSRTNRLFGPDKPFGIIKYYTFPHTMEQYINSALELYADRPLGVFVDKLEGNLMNINRLFLHIRDIFTAHDIKNFEKLPTATEDRNMFAKDFSQMTHLLTAAKLQEFSWDKNKYEFQHGDTYTRIEMELDENTYNILLQRYKELFTPGGDPGKPKDFIYPVDPYIMETGTGTIDADYMNSKFVKFVKNLYTSGPGSDVTKNALEELHKTFATLSQKDQRTATVILHDIQSGDLKLDAGKTIYDYINDYQLHERHKQIVILSEATGINLSQLENIMNDDVTDANLNVFNRFNKLINTIDLAKTAVFLEKVKGMQIPSPMVQIFADQLFRSIILDASVREQTIRAYLGNEEQEEQPRTIEAKPKTNVSVKGKIKKILNKHIPYILPNMRPVDEITGSVPFVLGITSIPDLDGVGVFIKQALEDLFGEDVTIVKKFISFNLLVTKFEAYLKKLYYVIHGREIKTFTGTTEAAWKDTIHAFDCLWNLKYSHEPAYQQLYQYLVLIKGWRNSESHISPTASEQEVDAAIGIIITMYFYTTGMNITELEMAGYDMEESQPVEEEHMMMAAEDLTAEGLTEQQKKEILRKAVVRLIGYDANNSLFTKQRHWESIYRVAADKALVIDGDYRYFCDVIEELNIEGIPAMPAVEKLEKLNTGIYAESFCNWTPEGLEGNRLTEYNDIRRYADKFMEEVERLLRK